MNKDPEEAEPNVVVANVFLHEKAGLSREEFLHRVAGVSEIRTEADWPSSDAPVLTCFPTNADQWAAIEGFHSLVRSGDFTWIEEVRHPDHVFAVSVPPKLFTWFRNAEVRTIQEQIVNWLAGVAVSRVSSKLEFIGALYRQVADEVRRVVNKHYAGRVEVLEYEAYVEHGKGDVRQAKAALRKAYADAAKTLTGSPPPSILQLFEHERDPCDHPGWGLEECRTVIGVTPFHFKMPSVAYFRKWDWKRVIEDRVADNMQRAESRPDFWDKWLQTNKNYRHRKSFVFSVYADGATPVHIYLLRDTLTGYHKIGHVAAPRVEKRRKQLQTGNPGELVEVGHFRVAGVRTETAIHELFKDKRIRPNSEWFALTEEDVANLLDEEWRIRNNIF